MLPSLEPGLACHHGRPHAALTASDQALKVLQLLPASLMMPGLRTQSHSKRKGRLDTGPAPQTDIPPLGSTSTTVQVSKSSEDKSKPLTATAWKILMEL
jgi:hypothetical protein